MKEELGESYPYIVNPKSTLQALFANEGLSQNIVDMLLGNKGDMRLETPSPTNYVSEFLYDEDALERNLNAISEKINGTREQLMESDPVEIPVTPVIDNQGITSLREKLQEALLVDFNPEKVKESVNSLPRVEIGPVLNGGSTNVPGYAREAIENINNDTMKTWATNWAANGEVSLNVDLAVEADSDVLTDIVTKRQAVLSYTSNGRPF